jgi:hypothetical protein
MTTASTKRNPAAVNGKVTTAVTRLTGVVLAFDPIPVTPEEVEKYKLNTVRKNYGTGVMGNPDILEGDVMTVSGVDYIIRAVGKITSPVLYTAVLMEKQM